MTTETKISTSPPETSPSTAKAVVLRFVKSRSVQLLILFQIGFIAWRINEPVFTWWDLVVVLAIPAFWPMLEWLIHTQILHFKPRQIFGRTFDPAYGWEHRRHHSDPWNIDIMFIPLRTHIIVVPLLTAFVWWVMPSHLAATFMVTMLVFTIHYEWCHYIAHVRWQAPWGYWRKRVRDHRLHHFHNEQLWWGVSMGGGDRIMGTGPSPSTAPRSATTKMVYDTKAQESA